jgi:hypothetical protein
VRFFELFFGVRSFGVDEEEDEEVGGGVFFPEFGDGTREVFGEEFSGDMARAEAGTARIPLRIMEEVLLA